MLFNEIFAHPDTKQRLINNLVQQRIAHAQLFVGKDGFGALPLALAYAQYLNCQNPTPTDSCGVCSSCYKNQKFIHSDVHFTFPIVTTAAKEQVCDDFLIDWRKALSKNPYLNYNDWIAQIAAEGKQGNINAKECRSIIDKITMAAYEGKYKILILWKPEFLGAQANILLKIIEEPPEDTVFLLITDSTENILATILSRVQVLRVPPPSPDDLTVFLEKKHPHATATAIQQAVFIAEGDYLLAKSIIDASDADSDLQQIFEQWMRSCYANKGLEIMQLVEKMAGAGREKQKQLLHTSVLMLRRCFNYTSGANTNETSDFVRKFAPFVHQKNIQLLINEFEKSQKYITGNVNAKIVWHTLSWEIAVLLRKKSG